MKDISEMNKQHQSKVFTSPLERGWGVCEKQY